MLYIKQDNSGNFDLVLNTENTEFSAVQTLIYTALFTDAVAPDHRIDSRYDRRGWWGSDTVGSGIWHVRRQALSSAARREAIEDIRVTLNRLQALADIEVTDSNPGSISALTLNISGLYIGDRFSITVQI